MIGEGISDGSIIIVQRDAEHQPGLTYVCVYPEANEATLKRPFKERDRWRFEPANPNLKPFYWLAIELRGRVVKKISDL